MLGLLRTAAWTNHSEATGYDSCERLRVVRVMTLRKWSADWAIADCFS